MVQRLLSKRVLSKRRWQKIHHFNHASKNLHDCFPRSFRSVVQILSYVRNYDPPAATASTI
jgi:hypothetical protein